MWLMLCHKVCKDLLMTVIFDGVVTILMIVVFRLMMVTVDYRRIDIIIVGFSIFCIYSTI